MFRGRFHSSPAHRHFSNHISSCLCSPFLSYSCFQFHHDSASSQTFLSSFNGPLQVPLLFPAFLLSGSSSSPLILYWFSDIHTIQDFSLFSHSHSLRNVSFWSGWSLAFLNPCSLFSSNVWLWEPPVLILHNSFSVFFLSLCFLAHFVLASSFSIIQAIPQGFLLYLSIDFKVYLRDPLFALSPFVPALLFSAF